MSVTVHIEDDYDISRGDMIVRVNNVPRQEQDIDLMICWFHEKPLNENGKYALRHTTREARCIIREVRYRMDVNTLHRDMESRVVGMNDIARISIRSTLPLFVDPYYKNRITGSVILIDEATNETVAAGMVI
jgi:sulfate adenylyltransferase subunit 1